MLNSSPNDRGGTKNHCQSTRGESNTVLPGGYFPRGPFACEKTMKRITKFPVIFTLCVALVAAVAADSASAQCNTCATPVVAYSPVVAPATTVTTFQPVDTGWYPGKLLDTWRMRRWGYTAPTAVTTTAAFAPTYSAAYAPMPVTTMMPVTSTAVVQTANFAPVTTSFATPIVTSFAPLGQRQVLMRPVVVASPVVTAAPVVAASACSACSACEVAAPCSSCAATTVVEQATYAAAPAPCAGCAQGSSITYADQPAAVAAGETSRPALTPQEAAPLESRYPDVTPPAGNAQQPDPGPAAENKATESSSYFEAPALFIPGDKTAQQETVKPANRAPSVDVWNAVYRGPAEGELSRTSYKAETRTQAEIDAEGWSSVPAK
jgi:hypothetical protein